MKKQNKEKTPYQLDPTDHSGLNIISQVIIDHLQLKEEDEFMDKKSAAKAIARLQKQIAEQRAEAQPEREKAKQQLEQNQRFTVVGLLDVTNLTDAEIITIFGMPSELLHSVKKDLAAAPSKIARLKKTMSAEKIATQLNLPINWVEKQMLQA